MQAIPADLVPHAVGDLIYYLAFLAGQGLFILKRAAMAIRSKSNPTLTRRGYLYANWDVLGIRTALESVVFWIWRHHLLSQLVALFGYSIPDKISIPVHPMVAFILGYIVDSLVDWASTSPKVPLLVRERMLPPRVGEDFT
jgi:hypothetical protein